MMKPPVEPEFHGGKRMVYKMCRFVAISFSFLATMACLTPAAAKTLILNGAALVLALAAWATRG